MVYNSHKRHSFASDYWDTHSKMRKGESTMLQAPIGVTYDYLLGYHSGQRLVKFSASLSDVEVKAIGGRRYKQASEASRVDRTEFVLGVMDGYHDEVAGIAHPLPVLESEEE